MRPMAGSTFLTLASPSVTIGVSVHVKIQARHMMRHMHLNLFAGRGLGRRDGPSSVRSAVLRPWACP